MTWDESNIRGEEYSASAFATAMALVFIIIFYGLAKNIVEKIETDHIVLPSFATSSGVIPNYSILPACLVLGLCLCRSILFNTC